MTKTPPANSHLPIARSKTRVALVHDWLTTMGGAEPLVLQLHKLFPDAPIYTSVYDRKKMAAFNDCDVRTTFLQKLLPESVRYKHVLWPVLRSFAFPRLDLSEFDIIISSSSAEAKSVQKKPGAIHICYCHTPTRYFWSHYEEFKKEFRFGALTWLIRPLIPAFVKWMRRRDFAAAQKVDVFVANSEVTRSRIKKYYRKNSVVISPPVNTKKFITSNQPGRRGFILWGRHVPYKRFDLAISACNQLGETLTVVGSGPDTARLKKLAGPTIHFVGRVSDQKLVELAHRSKAFLFPNEEDFGLSAVEALASGLPVVAYKKGGALDIIEPGVSGVFFEEQTVESLATAIQKIEAQTFSYNTLVQRSKRFDQALFASKMRKLISDNLPSKEKNS